MAPAGGRGRAPSLTYSLALINLNDLREHGQGLLARALEGVATDDGTVGAAIAQAADFFIQPVQALGLTAREDDDAAAAEAGLHDVLHALGHGRAVDGGVDLL